MATWTAVSAKASLGVAHAPSEAMWKRAAYLMQPPFLRELGFSATPFGAASAPSEAMVAYTVLYMVIALAVAVRWFGKRDL